MKTKAHLFIGVPSSRGLDVQTVGSILQLPSVCEGMTFSGSKAPSCEWGRNVLAYQFLQSGRCTHYLSVDDDVSFAPDVVGRMIARGVDVVGAAYRYKTQDIHEHDYRLQITEEQWAAKPVNGTVVVDGLMGGLMLVSRRAMAKMAAAYPEHKVSSPGAETLGSLDIYTPLVVDGEKLTEDFSFCHRWRALGGQCHLLLDAETAHHAGQLSWPGNFLDTWNDQSQQ